MKPYQKPPMEAAVLPATEMVGRAHSSEVLNRVSHQQRPPIPGTRGPPPHYKSRPPMYNPPAYPVPAPRTASNNQPGPTLVNKVAKPTARYHPSLSGSETDVSTSTENLTQEERFVLRHMERQEPQGEENGDPLNINMHPAQSMGATPMEMRGLRGSRPPMTSLDSHHMFPSLPRSLQEELLSQQQAKLRGLVPSSSPLSPMMAGVSNPSPHPHHDLSKLTPSVYSHPTAVHDPVLRGRGPLEVNSGAFFDHKAIKANNNGTTKADFTTGSNSSSTDIIAKLTKEMMMSDVSATSTASAATSAAASTTSPASVAVATLSSSPSPQSIINKLNLSPAKSLASKSDLNCADKDLAALKSTLAARKAAQVQTNNRLSLVGTGTPQLDSKSGQVTNNENLSRSQPDLFASLSPTKAVIEAVEATKSSPLYANTSEVKDEAEKAVLASKTSAIDLHQIETLKAENDRLRGQLSDYSKKIDRVGILEQEMAKIHQAYQSLLKHSEKREMLEKSARAKLQAVIINLSDANKEVSERHEAVMAQLMSGEAKNQNIPGLDAILRGEILRKDGLIRQLMEQNKMLLATKERQEMEMAAINETLEEQRAHIQFLGTSLNTAEANVVRLEEENKLKEGYADRVKQMTRSLDQLQKASEKREAMEKKLRAKLEEELRELREDARNGFASVDANQRPTEDLRSKLSEAEEKIIRLESERTQWEQRYLEETAMRQVAIDAASIPKDAKIAALEKTSAESEKLIADARNDKMRQFEEMQFSQRKCAEMENTIKTLETTLAEQNAAIRILQSKKNSSNVHNIEEILKMGGVAPNPQQPPSENVLNISIHNSPQRKLNQLPSVLATPPQYHSLNLTKKLSHAHHRSLTPSADMFLKHSATATPTAEMLRATPSAEMFRATPTQMAHTPAAEMFRGAPPPAHSQALMATPTSTELHRLSAPAEMLRATPTNIEMLRATPTNIEMLRATPTSVVENMIRASAQEQQMKEILRASPHAHFDLRATPTQGDKRREPSGTSEAFTHPGPTLINTADLYNPSLVGGTMPKMSMLREHKSPSKLSTSANVSGNSSNFFDDSIGSFMGPPATSSTASSSNIRHEATKSYDGSKSYMEVWRV